ncbi:unnamed protein product [Moneuplotes crassus]|uniref:Uncharacterized protein n=1 Tax=Euplotes crassus TaxID=5936 RepID=A0AAD1Y5Z6_EUPCR|nr:unnamed protein product [Moneuplotes crassus]
MNTNQKNSFLPDIHQTPLNIAEWSSTKKYGRHFPKDFFYSEDDITQFRKEVHQSDHKKSNKGFNILASKYHRKIMSPSPKNMKINKLSMRNNSTPAKLCLFQSETKAKLQKSTFSTKSTPKAHIPSKSEIKNGINNLGENSIHNLQSPMRSKLKPLDRVEMEDSLDSNHLSIPLIRGNMKNSKSSFANIRTPLKGLQRPSSLIRNSCSKNPFCSDLLSEGLAPSLHQLSTLKSRCKDRNDLNLIFPIDDKENINKDNVDPTPSFSGISGFDATFNKKSNILKPMKDSFSQMTLERSKVNTEETKANQTNYLSSDCNKDINEPSLNSHNTSKLSSDQSVCSFSDLGVSKHIVQGSHSDNQHESKKRSKKLKLSRKNIKYNIKNSGSTINLKGKFLDKEEIGQVALGGRKKGVFDGTKRMVLIHQTEPEKANSHRG